MTAMTTAAAVRDLALRPAGIITAATATWVVVIVTTF